MENFRYVLEKYQQGGKNRFICPACGLNKSFVRYIDIETGFYIDEFVGKCNRLEKCGYHFKPRDFFKQKGLKPEMFFSKICKQNEKPTFYFDEDELLNSLHFKDKTSNLFDFLLKHFLEEKVSKTFKKYFVGVSERWSKSVIFWQVDRNQKVRAGKIMLYDSVTGKRDKFKFNWKEVKDDNFEMRQVFFGIHLIDYYKKYKIGIVESEKTALLCDLFFDEEIVWIASGGLQGLNEDKFKDLIGREVLLFPDLSSKKSKINACELWKSKAEIISKKIKIDIKINTILDKIADKIDYENQEDLGDFIIKNLQSEKRKIT